MRKDLPKDVTFHQRLNWREQTGHAIPGGKASQEQCKVLFTASLPKMKNSIFPDTYTYWPGEATRCDLRTPQQSCGEAHVERNHLVSTNLPAVWWTTIKGEPSDTGKLQTTSAPANIQVQPHDTKVRICDCGSNMSESANPAILGFLTHKNPEH